jgi:hypothetical protein
MNQWHGIVESHTGDIDALVCPECVEKFPFRYGLVVIRDLMGCQDRKCALCGHSVADEMREHRMKEAA